MWHVHHALASSTTHKGLVQDERARSFSMMFIQTRPCEQTKVYLSFTNVHTSKLLAALLGVHVCLIVAKMPLHSAQGRPQRDYSAAALVHLGHRLPCEIVATSAVHVVDESFTGAAVSLLSVRLVLSVFRAGRHGGGWVHLAGGSETLDEFFSKERNGQ